MVVTMFIVCGLHIHVCVEKPNEPPDLIKDYIFLALQSERPLLYIAHRGEAICIAVDVASPETHLLVGGAGGWGQGKGIVKSCAPNVKMNSCCVVVVYLRKCFVC